jgi:hypothetical protein
MYPQLGAVLTELSRREFASVICAESQQLLPRLPLSGSFDVLDGCRRGICDTLGFF